MSRERPDYVVARFLLRRVVFPLCMDLEITGREHLPRRGAFLAVANHQSMIDVPLLQVILPRTPRVLAKIELFKHPIVRPFLHWGGAVPVRRGATDRAALRDAEQTLARGTPFAIFPEGTRILTGALSRGAPGAGLIAVRGKVPVIPMAFEGTPRILRGKRPHFRPKVRLAIGRPIQPEELTAAGGLQAATDLIMRRIAAMLPPEMRGVYADPEPTEPPGTEGMGA